MVYIKVPPLTGMMNDKAYSKYSHICKKCYDFILHNAKVLHSWYVLSETIET